MGVTALHVSVPSAKAILPKPWLCEEVLAQTGPGTILHRMATGENLPSSESSQACKVFW